MNEEHGGGRAAKAAADEKRREKAKNLRYRRAIAKDINWESIVNGLEEMQEEIAAVQWFVDSEDGQDTLISAMDNDEEEAFEFRMAFSSLTADVERMQETFNGSWSDAGIEEDDFNDYCAGIRASVDGSGDILGYDEYEEDFFGLGSYETNLAVQESQKRLMRMTKQQLIDLGQQCFNVAIQFVGLRARYDDLKAALDILRGQNAGYLQQIKAIEEAYDQAAAADIWDREKADRFDRMLRELPERVWLE